MDNYIYLPKEAKKKKRRKVKFEPAKYFSVILLTALIVSLYFYILNNVVIKLVQKEVNRSLSYVHQQD